MVVGVVLGLLEVLEVPEGLGVLEVVGVLEVGAEVEVVGAGELVVGELVTVGALVVGVVTGVQLTPISVAPAGSEGVVPGAKSWLSVWMVPSTSLMVTVQGSAEEADGRAAIPITTASAVIPPTTSFRLRKTVVNLLPRVCSS